MPMKLMLFFKGISVESGLESTVFQSLFTFLSCHRTGVLLHIHMQQKKK